MLPLFTTGQVKDGIDTGDLMLDLSEYMKKKDAATKTELETLTAVVAGKLDATPQHKHFISDVKDLTETLEGKYDTSKKYSYNVILSDSEKIPFLEKPRVEILEVSKNKSEWGYRFYVDDASGDLMILSPTDLLIATYSIAAEKWSFEKDIDACIAGISQLRDDTTGIETSIDNLDKRIDDHDTVLGNHGEAINENIVKITNVETSVNEHGEVLDNHYEALNAVCNATLRNISDITQNTNAITSCGEAINENITKINSVESIINSYIEKTDAVLKNHYDALLLLCQKHGMVDSNTSDENNITPN